MLPHFPLDFVSGCATLKLVSSKKHGCFLKKILPVLKEFFSRIAITFSIS